MASSTCPIDEATSSSDRRVSHEPGKQCGTHFHPFRMSGFALNLFPEVRGSALHALGARATAGNSLAEATDS